MSPLAYLYVGIGGALGSMARYGLGIAALRWWRDGFPWGTLGINVLGSFVITFFGVLAAEEGLLRVDPNHRLLVTVGVCGGFTTFSTFSLQTLALLQQGDAARAGLNAALSVSLCVAASWLGFVSAQALTIWSRR